MREHSDFFTGPENAKYFAPEPEQLKAFFKELKQALGPDAKFVLNVLKEVFPRAAKGIERRTGITGGGKIRNEKLLARNEDVYPTYFGYQVPDYKISNAEIAVLRRLSYKDLCEALRKFGQQKSVNSASSRALAFLERFQDYAKDLDQEEAARFIRALLHVGDTLVVAGDFGKGFLQLPSGNDIPLFRCTRALLGQIKTQDDRFTCLKEALSESS